MGLWDLILGSGTLNILFWLFVIVTIFGLFSWLGWWIFMKFFVYKYNFGVVGHTGRINLVKARIKRNRHSVRKFIIKGYRDKLDVVEPNANVDGLPRRLVAFDGMGNLVYIRDVRDKGNINSLKIKLKVDKVDYLKTALRPVERESMCYNEIEAARKHGKMPTEVKWAFGFSFLLIIVVVFGLFVQGKLLAKSYEISSTQMSNLIEATEVQANAARITAENTKVQQVIMSYIVPDYNISFVAD